MTEQEEPSKKENIKTRKKIWFAVLILLSVAIGVLVFFSSRSKPLVNQSAVTYSTDTPNESKKDADEYKWSGSKNDPKKIIIEKINVNAYVQSVGVDQNKKVAVPNNVHLAAWFKDSARPGNNGLSVIDGHVSGKTTDGVFKNLKNLQKGDTFKIEKGDGTVIEYVVFNTVTVPESQASAILFSQDPTVSAQINLITCGGQFNKQARQYTDRVIVSASQRV